MHAGPHMRGRFVASETPFSADLRSMYFMTARSLKPFSLRGNKPLLLRHWWSLGAACCYQTLVCSMNDLFYGLGPPGPHEDCFRGRFVAFETLFSRNLRSLYTCACACVHTCTHTKVRMCRNTHMTEHMSIDTAVHN